MKQLKLAVFAGVILGAAAVAPAVNANVITLFQNAYSYGDGGEFTAVTSPNNLLAAYAPAAIVNGGFETFCVEQAIEFNPGVTYNYNLSTFDSTGRPLTLGAAFLYSQFANGTLQGYDYTDIGRSTSAGQLESALWFLQGGQFEPGFPTGGAGNPFYDYAASVLGANNLEDSNDWKYKVEIVQLWDGNGNAHQNQLVATLPDAGATVGMFGVALGGLFWMGTAFRARRQ